MFTRASENAFTSDRAILSYFCNKGVDNMSSGCLPFVLGAILTTLALIILI